MRPIDCTEDVHSCSQLSSSFSCERTISAAKSKSKNTKDEATGQDPRDECSESNHAMRKQVQLLLVGHVMTMDNGRLSKRLYYGCTCIRSAAYHPAANGMVEPFHCQLKVSLRAADDPENWNNDLPLVLLCIHSSLKSDLDCSAAELVFDTTVRPPGEMISTTPRVAVEDPTNLLHRLRQFMRTLAPVPPRPSLSESYQEKDWRHALTSVSDVIESAGHWNHPTTAPSELPLVGPRASASNSELARRS
ncbi:hypothetical protein SprV_0100262100 [Sparganum proliferum]